MRKSVSSDIAEALIRMEDNQSVIKSAQRQQQRSNLQMERKLDDILELNEKIRTKINKVQTVVASNGEKLNNQQEVLETFKVALIKYAETLIRNTDLTNLIIEQLSIRQLSMMKMLDDKFLRLENKIGLETRITYLKRYMYNLHLIRRHTYIATICSREARYPPPFLSRHNFARD